MRLLAEVEGELQLSPEALRCARTLLSDVVLESTLNRRIITALTVHMLACGLDPEYSLQNPTRTGELITVWAHMSGKRDECLAAAMHLATNSGTRIPDSSISDAEESVH